MKFFEKTRDVLGRRPWLPAAVYFVLYGLVALTYFVAVAGRAAVFSYDSDCSQDSASRLRFVTRDGMKYFMDYSEGRIRRYPDPEWVYSKSTKDDAIFERLKAE